MQVQRGPNGSSLNCNSHMPIIESQVIRVDELEGILDLEAAVVSKVPQTTATESRPGCLTVGACRLVNWTRHEARPPAYETAHHPES
jgi:hypothetical protein